MRDSPGTTAGHIERMSIWHWLIVLAVLAIPGAIIWLAVAGVRQERRNGPLITPGFKGWLLLLAVGQTLAPLRQIGEVVKYYGQDDTKLAWEAFPGMMTSELILNLVIVAITVVTTSLMYGRSTWFRQAFTVQYVAAVLSVPLDVMLVQMALAGQNVPASSPEELGRWIGASFIGVPWLIYVWRSRRVLATFGQSIPGSATQVVST